MVTTDAPPRPLPRPYVLWLGGVTVSRLADAVLAFALGWAAAGAGATTAALVLTLGGLPRLVLLLVGGAVGDRVGARRVLVAGEAALLTLTAGLALALARFGAPTWLLLATALAVGTVAAFALPATGSMPRRLVLDEQLTRALALRQALGQLVLLTAAPLGGVLVGTAGLPVVAWGAAVTFAVSLCVLVAVRELSGPAAGTAPGAVPVAPRFGLFDGFRVVRRTPGLRRALTLTGAGAALILPVPSLLVPLLGRSCGWGPGTTGIVTGAVGAGVVAAALLALRRRPASAATGLAASAAGTLVVLAGTQVGGSAAPVVAMLGALVLGCGSGAFVARVGPLVLGSAPRTHLARVQALVGLSQLVPVMVANAVLGALVERTSAHWALAVTAAGLGACALWARRSA